MRGLFIYHKEIKDNNLSGIDKKVKWQIEELNRNGLNCELFVLENNINSYLDKILSRLSFFNSYPKWEYQEEFNEIDYIYIRRSNAVSKYMIKVFKKIKDKNSNIKIIYEIPTYPYDDELKTVWYNYFYLMRDIINRKKLKSVIDRIAVQNNVDNIFGIPTLNFTNGIKVGDIRIKKPYKKNNNIINLCAVASMEPWQGYERIIKGLNDYYKNGGEKKIKIHFVGEGSELNYYKALVNKYNLESNCVFYGYLQGRELSHIYNISDLAIDAFGRFKTGNAISTSLKSREYLAKGIPIIAGSNSDIIDQSYEFYLQFNNDNSIPDFNKIIEFYNKIYLNNDIKSIIRKIRNYAFEHCDISNTMKEVIEYIKK